MNGLAQDKRFIFAIFHTKMVYIRLILNLQPGHVESHQTITKVFDPCDYVDTR